MIEIKENILLAPYTSWLIGGKADYLCFPTQIEELKEAWLWAVKKNLPITFMGGGTNVLVSDLGIRGLTINLRKFSKTEVFEENGKLHIKCLSGTAKSEILKVFLKQQLPPALFLAGLPGDVGGGVVMNAGVSEAMVPREFGEIVQSFTVLRLQQESFQEIEYQHADLDWQYRHCKGWEPGVIIKAHISYSAQKDPDILTKVKDANRTRLSKQPLDMPSCGSVFINPVGHKAAQLIDSCGLKGLRIGDSEVSKKHCNFIVNLGSATAQDTWQLMMKVKSTVLEKTGVSLQTEVVRMGQWESLS